MNHKIAITFLCAVLAQAAWAQDKTASGKAVNKNPVSA